MNESGSGGYLTSVADVMSGLVFVFILVLMVFVIQFKSAADRQERISQARTEVIRDLTDINDLKRAILLDIEESLAERGIRVRVDSEHGILRLPESILFPSGSASLRREGEQTLRILASVLWEILPCYSDDNGMTVDRNCDRPNSKGKLETVFIEGHTDNVPIRNDIYPDNWTLSTARAIRTFQTLVDEVSELQLLKNRDGQPLFSVSGYADQRPVASNETETDRQLNRRIDLRFVMVSPQTPDLIQDVATEMTP